MKNKLNIVSSSIKSIDNDKDELKIQGYANTINKDRAGDVIALEAWTKGGIVNYLKNPILLFNHDYDEPVGKVTELKVTDKGLEITAIISTAAEKVYKLIKDEVLKAFSVSFGLKDAEYLPDTDTFLIKDLELFEISVVSIPCNQDSLFSLAKSFGSEEEYNNFKSKYVEQQAGESANAHNPANPATKNAGSVKFKELEMTPEELQALLAKTAEETAKAVTKASVEEANRKAAEERAAIEAEAKFTAKVTTAAERLMADVEKRFNEKSESLETIITELKSELTEKSQEIDKMRNSKRSFSDRTSGNDWKKEFEGEVIEAHILGMASKKGWSTKRATNLMEKVNAFSGIAVSSADFEQLVSTTIERDVQLQLVLAPLFRELPMQSATMILPILPDAGYAEFVSTATTDATAPKGNLDMRSATYGDEAGVTLAERTVSTKKLMSLSYLGNETEEDAIIPVLGLLRESMTRSHARAIEQAILVGNHADGIYGTAGASFDGLVKLAAADGHTTQPTGTFATTDVVTAADLFALRKGMGKYGIRPEEVVYIVSQDVYYDLIDDGEFQDANLVGEMTATKLKGTIGSVYGSNVIICPEFAAKAAAKFNAVAVNTRNYLVPRLRGMTMETQYDAVNQRNALVLTQRLGFIDIIDGAASKYALQYKASA